MSYSQAERALIYKIRKDWIAYTNSLPAGSSPLPVSRWLCLICNTGWKKADDPFAVWSKHYTEIHKETK
jgi:hypothetical protein